MNNAGIIKRVPLLEMPLEDFEEVIKTDLTGVFT
ncbi:MAG: gluconate 5-dehydrogenase, partial [Chitinophagales bacterium]